MMNLLERFVVAFESIAKSMEKEPNRVITLVRKCECGGACGRKEGLEVPPADEPPAGAEGKVAAAEPKKRRGRPTKAEVAAREAAKAIGAGEAEDCLDKPVEAVKVPVCSACGEVLAPENISLSKVDGRLIHIGCKAEEQKPDEVVKLPVEKKAAPAPITKEMVREKAVAFANRKQREMGDGRGAFIDVLRRVGGWSTVNDVPASRYAELVAALEEVA
ncbi:MAG: hypothetical protein ACOX6T_28045 [Myxococcales bacterium]|jgi:hypothetical protein